MKLNFMFSALALLGVLHTNAQNNTIKCNEEYVIDQVNKNIGDYDSIRAHFFETIDIKANKPTGSEATVYTIPVVFHIIYETDEDNIPFEQVEDAIKHLNIDYRKQNADTIDTRSIFKSVATDTEIEFALAKLDPNGNCTNGLTRTYSTLTEDANDNVKSLINWDNQKYLNIWVVRTIRSSSTTNGIVLGYAYKPSANQSFSRDGIVIRHDRTGTIGSSSSLGRTLVHEAGHYLGLDHPFNGGCFQGDNCADTPPVSESSFGCDLTANTCSNDVGTDLPDQIENYMDYADEECTNMFTEDQAGIMRASLTSPTLRGYLITTTNLSLTGISPGQALPCAPEAGFDYSPSLICEGGAVQFNDHTLKGNPSSYLWTFAGGTPATSTDANPIVNYASKGSYNVTLEVTNASGTSTFTKRGAVSVRSLTNTPYINAFSDDFENYPIPNENWHVTGELDTANFRYYTQTSFAGESCVTLQNFYATYTGLNDALTSHTISLVNSTAATLNFKYAFADRTNGNTDRLDIYVSDDCGQNWSLESSRVGPFLRTVSAKINTPWFPTAANEWGNGSVDLIDYALSPNPIMVKFEFTSGGGNNFYLDEVILAPTLSDEEFETANHKSIIYPNPANDIINITLAGETSKIEITDLAGRLVEQITLQVTDKTVSIPTKSTTAGIYFITIFGKNKTETQKIIIK